MWHGVTLIDPKYPDRSATHDIIAYGAGLAKAIGFKSMKWEFSTATTSKYPGTSWVGSPSSLRDLAQQPAFGAVFSDTYWDRHVINTFSLADPTNNAWSGKWNQPQVYENEMYDLVCYLLATFPAATFILQNWEGDWQLLNAFVPNNPIPLARLAAYRDFHHARIRGIQRARAATPSTGKVFYCLEMNRVLDGWGRRLLRDVLGDDPRGNVVPDYVGFSAYEAVEGWAHGLDQAGLEADIAAKLTYMVKLVRRRLPNVPILLTEYGWPIYDPTFVGHAYNIGALWAKVISVATSLGIEGQIPWQLLDNEELSPGNPRGFLMYDRNGSSTTVGALSASGAYFDGIL